MQIHEYFFNLFVNPAGRLRSGWRFCVFAVAFLLLFLMLSATLGLGLSRTLSRASYDWLLESNPGYALQHFMTFVPAVLAGWGCNYVLEDLPRRALGWTFQRGWWRDLLCGSLVGAASIVLATAIAATGGGIHFSVAASNLWPAVSRTIFYSALLFITGAAAEEALFRGYPVQTLMRSWPLWLALIPSSLLFASVHLGNPHVAPLTFVNTALAGVWLAVAYARTRSLWFPLGLHWAWNWMMGALLGLPVSGITRIAPEPLLRATDSGPAWLTGGEYGLEGGAACTLVLLLSTIFIWRTRLVSADEELKRMTDEEHRNVPLAPNLVKSDATASGVKD